MEKGFFLDGVNARCANLVIIERIQCAIYVFAYETVAHFAVINKATKIAQPTFEFFALGRLPKDGLDQIERFTWHSMYSTEATCELKVIKK